MSPALRADYVSHVLFECLPRLSLPGADMLAALAREAQVLPHVPRQCWLPL